MKDPGLVVGRILLPFLREPGMQSRQSIRSGQIPQHQPFKDRVAEEAHALEAVVGQSGCRGDIGRRHGDPQRGLGHGRLERQQNCHERERAGSLTNEHGFSLSDDRTIRIRLIAGNSGANFRPAGRAAEHDPAQINGRNQLPIIAALPAACDISRRRGSPIAATLPAYARWHRAPPSTNRRSVFSPCRFRPPRGPRR